MNKINLKSCKNIRDISYNNIKPKKLIRSAALNQLSDGDEEILLKDYRIKTIIDLRTSVEIKESPDKIINDAKYYNIPLVGQETLGITSGDTKEEKIDNLLKKMPDIGEIYTQLVTRDKKEQWTKIFEIFLDNLDDHCILWHCSQGKDRCGIVSAIIEYALDLDYKTILNDYLLSNEVFSEKAEKMYSIAYSKTNDSELSSKISNLFLAKEEYLKSSFEYIKKEYGSVDNFLIEMCNLNDKKLKLLKDIYLGGVSK